MAFKCPYIDDYRGDHAGCSEDVCVVSRELFEMERERQAKYSRTHRNLRSKRPEWLSSQPPVSGYQPAGPTPAVLLNLPKKPPRKAEPE